MHFRLNAGRYPEIYDLLVATAEDEDNFRFLSIPWCFHDFVRGFVRAIQDNVDRVLDLKELVVTYMDSDKTILVEMFQRVGKEELKFLVNSGLWFGFLLGIGQLLVWMFYDSPWTLTAGGTVVGYLTNWLALKCIFEPVEPVQFGPFRFQGLFPARQKEVSGEFVS